MKSRLLTRLDADIRGATSHAVADCLRCERAAYLARHGDYEAAGRELAEVRQRHGTAPRPSVYAWVNLAEGLVSIYSQPDAPGRDKIARAHALSCAAHLTPLRALASAWLGHLDLLRHDVTGAAQRAVEAFALAAEDDHGARGRAALVVAQAYDGGGRYDLARPWYGRSHWHATSDGDDAALSAMLWKMASSRVTAWRQAQACATDAADATDAAHVTEATHAAPGRHALACAESAALYDRLSGVTSRQALQPMLRAQVCTLMGQTDQALPLYETHLAAALQQGLGPSGGLLLADRAWCRVRAGQAEQGLADAAEADAALAQPGANGTCAPGHSRLAEVYAHVGDLTVARRHREVAAQRWAAHAYDQRCQVEALTQALKAGTAASPSDH